jgi:hypothetical protein
LAAKIVLLSVALVMGATAAGWVAGSPEAGTASPTTVRVETLPITLFDAEQEVREIVPSIIRYETDHRSYAGMTIALLRARYDRTIPSGNAWVSPADAGFPANVYRVAPTKQEYCLVVRLGRWYAWKHDRAGIIEHSTQPARVCNF